MAASQWLWEFSIHLDSEEAASRQPGEGMPACSQKTCQGQNRNLQGHREPLGGQEVGIILGKKMGPVTGTDSLLLQLLTRLP